MAKRGDPIDGLILLNKPLGISSNSALQKTMRLMNAQKGGHTGSLDPLASGMLPICFGEATKLSRFLFDADKSYQVIMQLGVKTATGDFEGDILATRDVPTLRQDDILSLFQQFTGPQQQLPSMYSAIKFNGQPLYKLAREGKTVERKVRDIIIHHMRIDGHNTETHEVAFEVRCSKGTYIRSLVDDMGERLGCGAFVKKLHRTYVAPFEQDPMLSLEDLKAITLEERRAKMVPIQDILSLFFPLVELSATETSTIRRGMEIDYRESLPEGLITLVTDNGQFLGLGEKLLTGRIAPRRLIQQD